MVFGIDTVICVVESTLPLSKIIAAIERVSLSGAKTSVLGEIYDRTIFLPVETETGTSSVWVATERFTGTRWILTEQHVGPLDVLRSKGWAPYRPCMTVNVGPEYLHVHVCVEPPLVQVPPMFLRGASGVYLYSNPSGSVVRVPRETMARLLRKNDVL